MRRSADYTSDGDPNIEHAATGMSDSDNEKDPEATQHERLSNTHMGAPVTKKSETQEMRKWN